MSQLQMHLAVLKIHYLPMVKAKLPFIVCVVIPLLAMLDQLRRWSKSKKTVQSRSAVELRRKLGVNKTNGAAAELWNQAWKALRDTAVMAASGLV